MSLLNKTKSNTLYFSKSVFLKKIIKIQIKKKEKKRRKRRRTHHLTKPKKEKKKKRKRKKSQRYKGKVKRGGAVLSKYFSHFSL